MLTAGTAAFLPEKLSGINHLTRIASSNQKDTKPPNQLPHFSAAPDEYLGSREAVRLPAIGAAAPRPRQASPLSRQAVPPAGREGKPPDPQAETQVARPGGDQLHHVHHRGGDRGRQREPDQPGAHQPQPARQSGVDRSRPARAAQWRSRATQCGGGSAQWGGATQWGGGAAGQDSR